jgi:hypothetical protein
MEIIQTTCVILTIFIFGSVRTRIANVKTQCVPGLCDLRPIPYFQEGSYCPEIPSVWPVEYEDISGNWNVIRLAERMNHGRPNECASVSLRNFNTSDDTISLVEINARSKPAYVPEAYYIQINNTGLAGFIGQGLDWQAKGMRSGRWELTGGGLFTGKDGCAVYGACGSIVIVGVTRAPAPSTISTYDTILYMTCQMATRGSFLEAVPPLNEMGVLSRTKEIPDYALKYYNGLIQKINETVGFLKPISDWPVVGHDDVICNY